MEYNYPKFTPEMKQTHTILIPNMAIPQFRLLEYALRYDGYKCEILGNCGSAVAQLGLKYVHNDTCYPDPRDPAGRQQALHPAQDR